MPAIDKAVFVLIVSLVGWSAAKQCYVQRCLNCDSEKLGQLGNVTECRINEEVSPMWLRDVHISFPASPIVAVDFVCLKMYANPEPTPNSLPDQIRGCVIAERADTVCKELVAEERARNRQARCFFCTGDLCNSAVISSPAFAMVTIGTLYKILITLL